MEAIIRSSSTLEYYNIFEKIYRTKMDPLRSQAILEPEAFPIIESLYNEINKHIKSI